MWLVDRSKLNVNVIAPVRAVNVNALPDRVQPRVLKTSSLVNRFTTSIMRWSLNNLPGFSIYQKKNHNNHFIKCVYGTLFGKRNYCQAKFINKA